MTVARTFEKFATATASAAWPLIKAYNRVFERRASKPAWAPAPLIKRRERTFPPLGWPRVTDSLCPACVKETRRAILSGQKQLAELITETHGEIKAHIVEENGEVWM